MTFGEASMSAKSPIGWQLVNIPITVEGKAKGGESAQFVPAIKFTAYLLIESDNNKGKPVLLSKEITHVDIPLSGGGTAKNEMYVGVFIPPSSAVRIQEKTKGDLKGKLLAVAIDAEFNGKRCMKKGEPFNIVYDKSIKKNLSDEWWTKSMGDAGAVLYSINETPFAAWSSAAYPQVAPAGAAPASSTIIPTSTPDTDTPDSDTPSTDTTSDTDSSANDSDSSESETADEEESSKSKSKKKRSKRSRR